ncbi:MULTISPECIES: PD-(D/E)XK nuclease family transposase [Saccharibacillus]|uniref:PD-(D/E)XK nuclease family transposase n=1 Tax=Saccharibacillus TaxID=456492 RepID=UPI00301D8DDD
MHFLELTKLGSSVPTQGSLASWLFFLQNSSTEYWEVLKMNEPELGPAMNTLRVLIQDVEARRVYEESQKVLHDEFPCLMELRRQVSG